MRALEEDDIHIYVLDHADAGGIAGGAEAILSPDEKQRAARYRRPVDRSRFTSRRVLLRHLLARYLSCRPEEIRFRVGRFGRPSVPGGVSFSVSQTKSLALLAFTRGGRIGADAEEIVDSDDFLGLGPEVFSESELRTLAEAPIAARAMRFYTTWTRKEALVKAFGSGLSGDPKRFTTEDAAGPEWRAWRRNGRPLTGWTLRDLSLHPKVRAAVAAPSAKHVYIWTSKDFLLRGTLYI